MNYAQKQMALIRQRRYSQMRSAIDTLKPLGVKSAWIRNCSKTWGTKQKQTAHLITETVRQFPVKNNLKVIRALKALNCPLTLEQQWILERNK